MDTDAWAWWQARRFRYNLSLALAGAAAYCLFLVLLLAFGQSPWPDWRRAIGATLMLGVGYLVVMGVANVCYLLGPGLETMLRPADRETYRRGAWAMGYAGSIALPFLFPTVVLAALLLSGGD
jgi:hypothetical protein